MNWMDPRLRGSAAYHPYALVSYPYWRRQPYRWDPDEFIFGDSGGFSVYSRGIRIDPRQAIEWQMRFCSVGVILDTPLGPPKDRRDFRSCLECTIATTKAALPLYRGALDAGTLFRWWGVVQGRTNEECGDWWEAIRRVYPFDAPGEGWAFKPWPWNDPEAVDRALDFMCERGIRRAHLLGQSSRLIVETLLCLAPKAGLDFVTFDSTSPITWANNGTLAIPIPSGWRFIRVGVWDYMLTCDCTSCTFLRQDVTEGRALIDARYWWRRMIFHNLLVMLAHFELLKRRYAHLATTP